MGKEEKIDTGRERRKAALMRVFGSAPWMKTKDVKHFRAKVFKSGNSLALRLPAGLGLEAGTEMDLRVENGEFFSFEPVDLPKRKFNIAKVAGSATNLEFIKPEDRVFKERPLFWDSLPNEDDKSGDA
ncbi:hypothetical protein [Novosphingobium sp.]|uniref:AbrB/MazE/SpoVT family DNA-binding domain-containing protein n=1 Tax=Novosphingobium sp. TaxID=1874826 RepID=UPI002B48E071|nr:hypothetical protein [Novosphingobium sp.]HKR92683.1 hypothetical protein [Novosphingobium sp.]